MSSLHFAQKKTPAGEDGYSDSRHLSWTSERVECLLSVVFFVWRSNSLINLKFLRTPFFFSVDCTCKLLFNYFFILNVFSVWLNIVMDFADYGLFCVNLPCITTHTHTHTIATTVAVFTHICDSASPFADSVSPQVVECVWLCCDTTVCTLRVSGSRAQCTLLLTPSAGTV